MDRRELDLIVLNLLDMIRLASDPTQPPAIYRPARRDAVRFARQAYRAVQAMTWREDLRRSIEASARKPYRPSTEPARNATYGTPGHWTGD